MAIERVNNGKSCLYDSFAEASKLGLLTPDTELYVQSWPDNRPPEGLTIGELCAQTGLYGHVNCRVADIDGQAVIGIFKQVFAFTDDGEQIWHAEFLQHDHLAPYLESRPFDILSGLITFQPVACQQFEGRDIDVDEFPVIELASMPRPHSAAQLR